MVGFNTPLTIHSDGPSSPAAPVKHGLEDFLFVDEETGKPAGFTDTPSDGATEQIITFKKPETETLGFDTNRPEVSEDFVLYGTSDSGINKSNSNAVIGSFEHDVTPKSSSVSTGGDELIFSPSNPELVTGGSSSSPLGGEKIIINSPPPPTPTVEDKALHDSINDILLSFTQDNSEPAVQGEAQTEAKTESEAEVKSEAAAEATEGQSSVASAAQQWINSVLGA